MSLPEERSSHLGHRARLRQRFAASGLSAFAPHEALELLLTFAIPRRDVKPMAHALIKRFGSLPRVLQASSEDLQGVDGIGEQAATLLAMLLPLFRLYQQGLADSQAGPADLQALKDHATARLIGEVVERFLVVALDSRGRIITSSLVSSGDDGQTAIYPRLIAAELLRVGAAACVLAHNHPSGLCTPSRADRELTQQLAQILSPLSISLKDHLIVAGDRCLSMQEAGLMYD